MGWFGNKYKKVDYMNRELLQNNNRNYNSFIRKEIEEIMRSANIYGGTMASYSNRIKIQC